MEEINKYVVASVQLYCQSEEKTHEDIAAFLNVSRSFIEKVHQHKKHYNLRHLFLLSILLKVSPTDFFPSTLMEFRKRFPSTVMTELEFDEWRLSLIENTRFSNQKEE